MTLLTEPRQGALEPLRAALIARAHAKAERTCADAEAAGQQMLAVARDEAAGLLADARAQGEADGAALLAVAASRANRSARGIVLAAQHAAYDELRQQALTAVQGLLADPARRARLTAVVSKQLGDEAIVRQHPDGGLVAETPDGRVVEASIEKLVDTALADLDVEQLWTPC